MNQSTSFGEWVQWRRKLLGFTQAELAQAVGCSVALIRKLESNERRASAQIAGLIADAFSVEAPDQTDFIRFARSGFIDGGASFLATEVETANQGVALPLTTREQTVLRLMSLHLTPQQMANRLQVKSGTVKWYVKQVYAKLNVHSHEEAMAQAVARQLIPASANYGLTPISNNLPASMTTFVGRKSDIEAIRQHLMTEPTRLLTLVGPPGVGKTRLSLQAASTLLDDFLDGVYFVTLAPIRDPKLVEAAIAQVLDIRTVDTAPVAEALKQYLRYRRILLVIDNFEHVLVASPLIAEILAACPSLKVLATSREALRIYGEQEYRVAPLALPDADCIPVNLLQFEATNLFIQRVQAADAEFELTEEDNSAICAICRRLEGLPLAIELAAARIKLYNPRTLLKHLVHPLDVLTGGARDLPPRHRVLRDAIAWSYDLLDDSEKALFTQFSVFIGSWSLEAMQIVCDRLAGTPEQLESLINKGLAQNANIQGGEPRFRVLETLREFALEKLAESGNETRLRQAHADYFLSLAEQGEPQLRGQEQIWAYKALEEDQGNFRAALEWYRRVGEGEKRLRLATALAWFWIRRGSYHEGLQWLETALHDATAPDRLRSRALQGLTMLSFFFYDFERLKAVAQETLVVTESIGDNEGMALALSMLGVALWSQSDLSAVLGLMERAIKTAKQSGNDWVTAVAFDSLAIVYLITPPIRDAQRASTLAEEGLMYARRSGERYALIWLLLLMARIERTFEHDIRAESLLNEGLALAKEMEDKRLVASVLLELVKVTLRRGDTEGASVLHRESARLCNDIITKSGGAVEVLIDGAELALLTEQRQHAARLLGAAQRFLDRFLFIPTDIIEFQALVISTQAKMEPLEFNSAWAAGQDMTQEQAAAFALQI